MGVIGGVGGAVAKGRLGVAVRATPSPERELLLTPERSRLERYSACMSIIFCKIPTSATRRYATCRICKDLPSALPVAVLGSCGVEEGVAVLAHDGPQSAKVHREGPHTHLELPAALTRFHTDLVSPIASRAKILQALKASLP